MKPILSIITIVFNGEKTIERTIKSVLDQNISNLEYLLIDGGSTDNTLSIIKKYEQNLAKIISEPDNGIADAFNKGLKLASGDYVAFLNSDDWYCNGALSKVLPLFGKHDVIHANIQYWNNNKKGQVLIGDHTRLNKEMTINHPATFIRRNLAEGLGGFNTSLQLAMDYEMFLKAFLKKSSFYHINEVVTNMSLSGLGDENWLKSCKENFKVKQQIKGKSVSNQLWLIKQVSTIAVVKILTTVGLSNALKRLRSSSKKWSNEN